MVTKGASKESSTLLTYAADAHELYGDLRLTPAGQFSKTSRRTIIEWDTGKRLGDIPQVYRTYEVIGQMNEHQVAIGESTFTGRPELQNPHGTIDYGSLMQLALERSTTAREAISVMTSLVEEYGYASTGESFSISDPNEAWLMEMIGKGPDSKGAVWVARKIPDGMMTAHANHARIRTFPLHDKDTLYSKDVISFARAKGYFEGKDEAFSFADAYAPLTWEDLRFCEARVWSVFRRAAPSLRLSADLVTGTTGERLPLWIKPDEKLSVAAVMALMRDHFEGTPLDMTQGLGAGPYQVPYRWRPLTWSTKDSEKTYLNERAISTQQTGFSLVTQSRANLPHPIGGVQWFGVDDTFTTVWVPIYAGVLKAPPSFAPGVADLHHFRWDSAFWVFNWVANQAYARYSEMIVDIQAVQRELEGEFLARQSAVEQAALERFRRSPQEAREYLTNYSVAQAERTVERWRKLGEALLVKYLDGNLKDELGHVKHPGYPATWRNLVAQAEGSHLAVLRLPTQPSEDEPISVAGYFHSRDELGTHASEVPPDFDFDKHKLLLVKGTDTCGQPWRCCLTAETDGNRLVVSKPKNSHETCGTPNWLLKLPSNEKRPLVLRR